MVLLTLIWVYTKPNKYLYKKSNLIALDNFHVQVTYDKASSGGHHYAQGSRYVMLCCVLVSVDFIHILQGYLAGTGAIIRLSKCQSSNHEACDHTSRESNKEWQYNHSHVNKTVHIFHWIYFA